MYNSLIHVHVIACVHLFFLCNITIIYMYTCTCTCVCECQCTVDIITGVHNVEERSRSVKRPHFNWIFFLPTRASGYTIFRMGVV